MQKETLWPSKLNVRYAAHSTAAKKQHTWQYPLALASYMLHLISAALASRLNRTFFRSYSFILSRDLLTLRMAILQSLFGIRPRVYAHQLKACSIFYLMPTVPSPLLQLEGGDFLFIVNDCWAGKLVPYTCTVLGRGVRLVRQDCRHYQCGWPLISGIVTGKD